MLRFTFPRPKDFPWQRITFGNFLTEQKPRNFELHSTPMTATADQRGIVVFCGVEDGGHILTVKDQNNAVLASKNFELLFGDGFRIEGDRITAKNRSAFTVTA